jgi:endonuclease YncB( thermonuclease family)
VQFQTGDTWTQGGQIFRLYAVQSCIRGTTFTNAAGIKRDCGEASIAYFAALIKDAKPRCTTLARSGSVTFTVCAAHIGGQTLDLGTIFITQGFAFAATDPRGKPVSYQYAVAEGEAQKNRRGLWASPDLPHPSAILRSAYQKAN